jgi:hypothetical protein
VVGVQIYNDFKSMARCWLCNNFFLMWLTFCLQCHTGVFVFPACCLNEYERCLAAQGGADAALLEGPSPRQWHGLDDAISSLEKAVWKPEMIAGA